MKQYDGVVTVKGNPHYLTHAIAPVTEQSVHVDDRRRMGALQRALDDLYQGSYTQKVADNYTAPTIQHTPATDAMLSGMDRMYATMGNGLPPSSLDRVTYDNALPTKFTSSKGMKARTPAQVVAAEAGGKTLKDRFQAMKDVFSAVYNRSVQTGVPVKDITSVKSQFSAYNETMPAGTQSLVSMAQRAIDSVLANGPTHKGTYYATPDRVSKLPSGLQAVKTSIDGMKYYSDPKNRSIITASGTKKPSATNASYAKNLPASTNAVPSGRPARSREIFDNIAAGRNIQVSKPFSPEKYASAVAPREVDPGPLTRGLSTFDVARAITPQQAQAKVAAERQRVAAETEANRSVFSKAGTAIGGFFDSLTGRTTAAAGPTHPNNFSTPKTDRLAKAPTATYADVMAGKPVKTTTIQGIPETKPEAIYDDPRALAYAEKMTPEPVNSLNVPGIDPALAAKVTPDQPVAPIEETAVPQRAKTVQRTRYTHPQITVTRPNRVAIDPTAGMTLGGVKAADRFSVGSGLKGVTNALGGPYGATAQTSNRSVSVTSRGNLGSFRYNKDTGVTQYNNPAGVTTGVSYGKPGGFLGALGRSLGGNSKSGKSGSSNGGRSSGRQGGARGAAGGSLGQSQRSL